MLEKSEAIVLHTIKYGESKIIVDMFTKRWGRLSFIIPVPKTSKSRIKKQYFQPMSLLEIECEVRPRVTLQKLSDARLLTPFVSIPLSPEKLAISMFVAEFLYYGLRSEQHNELLFDYISGAVQWLDAATDGFANFHLTFLMHLSRFLGFYPNLEEGDAYFDLREGRFCANAPTHRDFLMPVDAQLIRLMMRMDFPTMHLFVFTREQRQRLLQVLNDYYRLHVPHFPELRSMAILREVLS